MGSKCRQGIAITVTTRRCDTGGCKLFLAVIRTPPSRRSPNRSLWLWETYKPLISRAIFLIFFLLCLFFLFFHISFFIFYRASRTRDDKRSIPRPRFVGRVNESRMVLFLARLWNAIIRYVFLDGQGMKGYAWPIIIFARLAANIWYARVNYSISLANITPCISSN